MKIRIGSIDYELIHIDKDSEEIDLDFDGLHSALEQTIHIRLRGNSNFQNYIFWHEFSHALLFQTGTRDLVEDEVMCNAMSLVLYNTFGDYWNHFGLNVGDNKPECDGIFDRWLNGSDDKTDEDKVNFIPIVEPEG